MRSLTGELRRPDSPIRRFFVAEFPRTAYLAEAVERQLRASPPLLPPPGAEPVPWSTLGTAIDYRLRYAFQVRPTHRLDAFRGAQYLTSNWPGPCATVPLPRTPGSNVAVSVGLPRVVQEFFRALDALLARVRPARRRLDPPAEAALCRACYLLALLEQVLRNPTHTAASPLRRLGSAATLDDLLALVEPAWVEDLCRLSRRFADRCATLLGQPAVVGPRAGAIGGFGAAADLLVGGCLLDIKTTIRPVFDPHWLSQVLGYVLLDARYPRRIGGVGFYFPRQGVLLRWGLAALLPRLTGDPDVRLDDLQERFRRLVSQLPM